MRLRQSRLQFAERARPECELFRGAPCAVKVWTITLSAASSARSEGKLGIELHRALVELLTRFNFSISSYAVWRCGASTRQIEPPFSVGLAS